MNFAGLVPVTMVDYPSTLAATVFTAGCPLRCGFCQNPQLVIGPVKGRIYPAEEILGYLERRKKVLRGLCVTGGEPTIHKDLGDFLREVRTLGYRIKLDTSGIRPDAVEKLLNEGLVGYVAMDIKWSFALFPGGLWPGVGDRRGPAAG